MMLHVIRILLPLYTVCCLFFSIKPHTREHTTSTSTSTAPPSTTTASKTTSAVPTFTGGASIERVMIAGVAAVAGFAGLMIA